MCDMDLCGSLQSIVIISISSSIGTTPTTFHLNLLRTCFGHEYGNCFTFNANYKNDDGVNVNPAWEVTMTGGSATLSVVLYLDQLFYTPLSLSKKAGARITIHNPKVFPMTEEYGINLKPNTASNIGFQQVLFHVIHCFLYNIV